MGQAKRKGEDDAAAPTASIQCLDALKDEQDASRSVWPTRLAGFPPAASSFDKRRIPRRRRNTDDDDNDDG